MIVSAIWDMFQAFIGTNGLKRKILHTHLTGPMRILEIGCGTGNISGAFQGFDYTGIDTNEAHIRWANAKYRGKSKRFLAGDASTLKAAGGGLYDCVVLSHTLHHLPDDVFQNLIQTIADLLRQAILPKLASR